MTSKVKDSIKGFFETNDKPTQAQFIDLIDSYVDKSGPVGTLETACSANGSGVVEVTTGTPSISSYATFKQNSGITVSTTADVGTAVGGLYSTTAQAQAGTNATTVMNPVLTKNAINALAFTTAAYSTTAQGNAGTDATTVMNPVLVKNAIAALAGTSAMILLSTQTASASATLDFTSLISSTYSSYIFEFDDIRPASDGVDLWCRTSTNNGSSFDSSAGNYSHQTLLSVNTDGADPSGVSSTSATQIVINDATIGNAAAEGLSGKTVLRSPAGTARNKILNSEVTYQNTSTASIFTISVGARLTTADIDAVRFMMSSGNITSGKIRMYGVT